MSETPIVAIVEDDEAVREALSDLLLVRNLPYRTFGRAESFLAAYMPGRFGCLITDVRMPGIGGLELQQRLRALGSSVPVIFITSATDPETRARALDAGAYAFLTKPVGEDVLIGKLKSALNLDAMRANKKRQGDT